MKTLGTLDNGDLMVQASRKEIQLLSALVDVARGRAASFYVENFHRDNLDADVSTVLAAVVEWMEIKMRSNALRNIADEIDRALAVPANEQVNK
jgi:hypothetical protein